jgi:flavin reductase (DIM6/NTAB) family NADH-FMN oxidoreductase RutF
MLKEIRSDIYHLLHPKITFFLTSVSKTGKPNVMTCAWATPVSDDPPMVMVCIAKDSFTADLIQQTKEFAINIPSKKYLKALWTCGSTSGRKTDKFKKANLTTSPAQHIKAPLIDGCIGHIECRVWKTVEAGECYAFFGQVLSAFAECDYLRKGLWTEAAKIPMHLGGSSIVYAKKN